MSAPAAVVPMLVFEAADCLMAVIASEVAQLEKRLREPFSGGPPENGSRSHFDLCEYFGGHAADGPWLGWARGTCTAWLRVRRVVDVVPVAIAGLTPMPALLQGQERTRAFLARFMT